MKDWLEPVRMALYDAAKPATFFFRNDDGGWADDRLWELMALCADKGIPLDVAVIPNEINPEFSREMTGRREAHPKLFGIHQHGFSHRNHETIERKCEFGPSRSAEEQFNDIKRGLELIRAAFGNIDPIFTPPWNRCSRATAVSLKELGFNALSRDETAESFETSGLTELPINVDWFAKKKGILLSRYEIGEKIASKIRANETVGIMFHHALMDSDELTQAGRLFDLLAGHHSVKLTKMNGLCRVPQKTCTGVTI